MVATIPADESAQDELKLLLGSGSGLSERHQAKVNSIVANRRHRFSHISNLRIHFRSKVSLTRAVLYVFIGCAVSYDKSLNIFHVFSKKVSAEIFPLERRLHKPRLVALRIFRTKRSDRNEK